MTTQVRDITDAELLIELLLMHSSQVQVVARLYAGLRTEKRSLTAVEVDELTTAAADARERLVLARDRALAREADQASPS